MLNYIWLGLMLASVLIAGFQGKMQALTDGAFEATKTVMTIVLALVPIMALWLGIMRLAERSGLVQVLARVIRPVMSRLFPDVPPDHPAMGSMVMNMAANMLGLGNAATALGLRAMNDLEKLNRTPGTATNAMCTFLAINTSSLQLIPMTTVGILAAAGSVQPTAIIGTTLMATAFSTIAGILSVKFYEKLPTFRLPKPEPTHAQQTVAEEETSVNSEPAPLRLWGKLVLIGFVLLFAFWFVTELLKPADANSGSLFVRAVGTVSILAIPFLIAFFPLYAALRRVPVYEEFVDGAKEGFNVAVRIIPYLVAILVAVGMLRAVGGIDLAARALAPVLDLVGLPPDLLSIVLVRPLSGSATTGLFTELVKTAGPDSLVARMAGTILGSTETTFYVIAVYFGSVAVRRTRHAIAAGLTADLVGVIAAVIVCRIVFGN